MVLGNAGRGPSGQSKVGHPRQLQGNRPHPLAGLDGSPNLAVRNRILIATHLQLGWPMLSGGQLLGHPYHRWLNFNPRLVPVVTMRHFYRLDLGTQLLDLG